LFAMIVYLVFVYFEFHLFFNSKRFVFCFKLDMLI
jgi:hypothetical protein